MNYYELSNTVTPDTIGYKNGLWQKRYCADLQSIDCCMECFDIMLVVWNVP